MSLGMSRKVSMIGRLREDRMKDFHYNRGEEEMACCKLEI